MEFIIVLIGWTAAAATAVPTILAKDDDEDTDEGAAQDTGYAARPRHPPSRAPLVGPSST